VGPEFALGFGLGLGLGLGLVVGPEFAAAVLLGSLYVALLDTSPLFTKAAVTEMGSGKQMGSGKATTLTMNSVTTL
jgi:hypothetical protein